MKSFLVLKVAFPVRTRVFQVRCDVGHTRILQKRNELRVDPSLHLLREEGITRLHWDFFHQPPPISLQLCELMGVFQVDSCFRGFSIDLSC